MTLCTRAQHSTSCVRGSRNTFQSLWVPTTYIFVEKLEKVAIGTIPIIFAWVKFVRFIPQKVSLEMLNWADFDSFSDLFSSVQFWAIDHLNMKLVLLCRHAASFKI